jgi:hypothetical protein
MSSGDVVILFRDLVQRMFTHDAILYHFAVFIRQNLGHSFLISHRSVCKLSCESHHAWWCR